MSSNRTANVYWMNQDVTNLELQPGTEFNKGTAASSSYQYQSPMLPPTADEIHWLNDFDQQSFHYHHPTDPQSSFYHHPEQTLNGLTTPNTGQQLYDLLARLFPTLPHPITPEIPASNPNHIHQVKIPLNDIYRPLWIRKEGSEREGHCRYCPTWANLKHSNYAYHMLKRHGVCKAHAAQFEPPQALQMVQVGVDGQQQSLLAWCANCRTRVQLAGNASLECDFPRLTASWYSHAKECLLSGSPLE